MIGSVGAVVYIGLSEILAPDLTFTPATCPPEMGGEKGDLCTPTRPVLDVHNRQVTGSSVVPFFNHPGLTWLA